MYLEPKGHMFKFPILNKFDKYQTSKYAKVCVDEHDLTSFNISNFLFFKNTELMCEVGYSNGLLLHVFFSKAFVKTHSHIVGKLLLI